MTFFIKTYGCQMNVNDSEKIRSLLQQQGLQAAATEEEADLIIVNSCAVRQKPQEKIYSYIGRFPREKIVVLAGCVAQVERQEVFRHRRSPDFILGTHQLANLPGIVAALQKKRGRGERLGFTRQWQEIVPAFTARTSTVTAFLSIMEGCNNFCSYCIVPFARGREKYRPYAAIMAEAEELSRLGYPELLLLGQNVNAWRDDASGISFPVLLARLARETRFHWIRFITSNPGYHDEALLDVIASHRSITRHLHFPAQSGSTRILRRMNRSYSRSDYLRIIGNFRRDIPGFGFSSDFITGFPGETDRDFEATLSLLQRVKYDSIFSFVYSPRPRTAAYRWDDPIPMSVKKERLHRLQQLQADIQLVANHKLIGRTVEILISEEHPKKPGEMIGRTETYRVVNLKTDRRAGEFTTVEVYAAGPHSLQARELDS